MFLFVVFMWFFVVSFVILSFFSTVTGFIEKNVT